MSKKQLIGKLSAVTYMYNTERELHRKARNAVADLTEEIKILKDLLEDDIPGSPTNISLEGTIPATFGDELPNLDLLVTDEEEKNMLDTMLIDLTNQ